MSTGDSEVTTRLLPASQEPPMHQPMSTSDDEVPISLLAISQEKLSSLLEECSQNSIRMASFFATFAMCFDVADGVKVIMQDVYDKMTADSLDQQTLEAMLGIPDQAHPFAGDAFKEELKDLRERTKDLRERLFSVVLSPDEKPPEGKVRGLFIHLISTVGVFISFVDAAFMKSFALAAVLALLLLLMVCFGLWEWNHLSPRYNYQIEGTEATYVDSIRYWYVDSVRFLGLVNCMTVEVNANFNWLQAFVMISLDELKNAAEERKSVSLPTVKMLDEYLRDYVKALKTVELLKSSSRYCNGYLPGEPPVYGGRVSNN